MIGFNSASYCADQFPPPSPESPLPPEPPEPPAPIAILIENIIKNKTLIINIFKTYHNFVKKLFKCNLTYQDN